MTHMTGADFEARYQNQIDPWGYASSDYEREKYAATLEACGPGPFSEALELAGSIGVFSALLAPRCQRLSTVDGAPTAVAAARERLADQQQVEVGLGFIPAAIPDRRFDLVVASEILYYLDEETLNDTLAVLNGRIAEAGRLVAVHWRPPGPERPFTAAEVHARLRSQPGLHSVRSVQHDQYLLDVLERR